MLTSATWGETLTPNPDPNPGGGVNYLTLRVQFYGNECNWWGAAPTNTIYTRGGANYLTLRVQFYANECNEGRYAYP